MPLVEMTSLSIFFMKKYKKYGVYKYIPVCICGNKSHFREYLHPPKIQRQRICNKALTNKFFPKNAIKIRERKMYKFGIGNHCYPIPATAEGRSLACSGQARISAPIRLCPSISLINPRAARAMPSKALRRELNSCQYLRKIWGI
jgi:hypothetical protein